MSSFVNYVIGHWFINPSVERYSLSLRIKPPCNHYSVEANVYRRSITHGCLLLEMWDTFLLKEWAALNLPVQLRKSPCYQEEFLSYWSYFCVFNIMIFDKKLKPNMPFWYLNYLEGFKLGLRWHLAKGMI